MPDMSDGHDNTVETWYKKPGDIIKYNDILCDIATQDFTFGLSMDDNHDAIMGEIHVEAGTTARDGAPICTVYHPEDESGGKKK
jgi:pyruvate/2-oxoglutarate dehydrogenase complex dihydrolipoamide acyltransferase (E2) component